MTLNKGSKGQAKSLRTGVGIRQGGKQYDAIHRSIAKAALVELSIDGYERLDFRRVADRAGVSERTAYRHYQKKLDLAIAGILQMPDYTGWGEGDDAAADRLRRGLTIGAAHRDYLGPVTATAMLNRESEPELLRALSEHVLSVREQQIAIFLEDGQRAGEIRPDISASTVSALVDGLLLAHHRGRPSLGTGKTRVARLFDAIWPLIATDEHLND
ncbi:MAG: TetR/AcrR family transcriptional regulator [Candidatus Nanopelagicales bacterium]